MATTAEVQRQSFEDRVSRIKQGGPNTLGTTIVGPREEVRAKDAKKQQKAVRKQITKMRRRETRKGSPVATAFLIPIGLMVGAVSIFAGRVATFRFFTTDAPYAFNLAGFSSSLFVDFAIAGCLAMLLAWAFRLNFGMRRLAVLAGFAGMMAGEVLLMEQYPDVFAMFFSESYVAATLGDQVIATAENSATL